MPGGDGTGPIGYGAKTGRGAGFCAGFSGPGYSNSIPGRGFGQGWNRGIGRGSWRRRRFWIRSHYQYPTNPILRGVNTEQSKEDEKSYLEEMVKDLEEEIKDIHERIKELSKEK